MESKMSELKQCSLQGQENILSKYQERQGHRESVTLVQIIFILCSLSSDSWGLPRYWGSSACKIRIEKGTMEPRIIINFTKCVCYNEQCTICLHHKGISHKYTWHKVYFTFILFSVPDERRENNNLFPSFNMQCYV